MKRVIGVAWIMALLVCPAGAGRADDAWVEDFNSADGWTAKWKRPAELAARNGVLTLVSSAEGSSAVTSRTPAIDLEKYRYLVIKVTEISGKSDYPHQFRMSLNFYRADTRLHRADGVCSVYQPGFLKPATVVVVDMWYKPAWRVGKAEVELEIQACGGGTRVDVDYVKFTDAPTKMELAAWERTKARNEPARPTPFHGMEELSTRRGWIHEPYFRVDGPSVPDSGVNANSGMSLPDSRPWFQSRFAADKRYLSERLIYRDTVTGNTVWRMTHSPDMDMVTYFNVVHWNADGSLMRWASGRGGASSRFMNADGTDLRAFKTPRELRGLHWSNTDPNTYFMMLQEGKSFSLHRGDIRTGDIGKAIAAVGGAFMPPHPDDRHFLVRHGSTFTLLGPDGLRREFDAGGNIGHVLFTRNPQHDILCGVKKGPKAGYWWISADDSRRIKLKNIGYAYHPDCTWDGEWLIICDGGVVKAVRYHDSATRVLSRACTATHGSPARDLRSYVGDVGPRGPWGHSIQYIDMPTRTAHKVCLAWSSYYGTQKGNFWHPRRHSTHPHPSSSPDATKTIFSSDFMSKYVDVFVAINHLPDTPRDVKVEREALIWKPGERHLEVKGYYVYRAEQSGGPYQQVNAEPLGETQFPLAGKEGFCVVTAVEHSGLESLPSMEVCTAALWRGRVRRAIEAESCALGEGLRLHLGSGTAVGMYCVGMKEGMKSGSLIVRVNVPRKAEYRLLARVRRKGSIEMAGGRPVQVSKDEWLWHDTGRLRLEAGEQKTTIRLAGEAIQVDQLVLTDEGGFVPSGPVLLDENAPEPPAALEARVLDPFTVRLSWRKSKSIDVSHYNVYCGRSPKFAPSQARRIGSPAELAFIDWGLKPGKAYYYRLVAVDRSGNESPAAAVAATTARAKIASLRIEAEAGELAPPAKAVADRGARNGKAVEFPEMKEEKSGALTVTFEVPFDGQYAIWAHVRPFKDSSGATMIITVKLDDQPAMPWRVRVPALRWGWDFVGGRKAGGWRNGHINVDPLLLPLRKGKHTLRLTGNQGHRLDRLVVSNDPGWDKNGYNTMAVH